MYMIILVTAWSNVYIVYMSPIKNACYHNILEKARALY